MNDEDAQLIEAALGGQTDAFGRLVQKYQDRLYHAVAHMMGSKDDAQDVVQDAFVQAFVKLDTFRGKAAFYTWLYRIAFNASVSRRRRQKPTVSVERSREVAGEEPSENTPPEERMQQQERAEQVQAALTRLSEEHRQVLVLREMEGCDYDTIAEILELPVGTVRSRLHRARLQLREELAAMLQEDLKE